jgi:hypothetical protein
VSLTTRKLSDKHEEFLVALFGGRRTKGSGNQWHNPMDGRTSSRTKRYAFAWDGKATLSKSVGVSLEMWRKAVEQAGDERTMLPLRFYRNESLEVGLDLVVMSAYDAAEVIDDANCLAEGEAENRALKKRLADVRTVLDDWFARGWPSESDLVEVDRSLRKALDGVQ